MRNYIEYVFYSALIGIVPTSGPCFINGPN